MNNLIVKKCFICDWSFHHYWTWKDFWYKTTDRDFNIIKCSKCWLEQIYPLPCSQEQSNFYPKNYYSYTLSNPSQKRRVRVSKIYEYIFSFFESSYWNINSYRNWKWKNFLEIGCWDWFLLRTMEKYGWHSEWFEIWEKWKKWNIYFWKSICDLDFNKKYDLILLKHVFEHVDDPIWYLKKISDILSDDWKCILIWPVINNISSNIFWIYAAEREIPRHLFNYNNKNLSILLWRYFIIKQVENLRQISFLHSIVMFIEWMFSISMQKSILKPLFYPLSLFFELILTIVWHTNQILFILEKK